MPSVFHQTIETDVLVLGGGLAGIRAAIEARRRGAQVLIASAFKVGYANNSAISYGGFNATDYDEQRKDSPERHYEDTLKGGCGLNQPFLVRLLAEQSWGEVKELEKMGVQFEKNSAKEYIRLGRGGHSVPRRLSTLKNSGMALVLPLLRYAMRLNIEMLNGVKAVRLLKQNSQISGALLMDIEGKWYVIASKSVILATGGGAALYPKTTNVATASGDGYALAYEIGLSIQDMEFVQFVLKHVREAGVPGRISPVENLLQKGAKLLNSQGKSLQDICTKKLSFTRDTISRMVAREIANDPREQGFLYLDLRDLPKEDIDQESPIKKTILKVYPAAHFFMGGIRVNREVATSIKGLYAAGEVMGGVHGANRLGGNALAETFVFGFIAGSKAAQFVRDWRGKHPFRESQATQIVGELIGQFGRFQDVYFPDLEKELNSIMDECGGVIRDKMKIEAGLSRLRILGNAFFNTSLGPPKDYWRVFTFQNKLIVAEMVLKAAFKREETRGAHYREDFPNQDDEIWLTNILLGRDQNEQMKLSLNQLNY